MKAIMMSIRPEWVAKILNGEKTIEIRKKFPKDYVGWVYIYCTKNGNDCYGMPTDLVDYRGCAIYNKFKLMPKGEKVTTDDNQPRLNGKVVARFWCDKVEEMVNPCFPKGTFVTKTMLYEELLKQSCLTKKELDKYIGKGNRGYAIHVTNLEIFDKPKELSEFNRYCNKPLSKCPYCPKYEEWATDCGGCDLTLTRAPQSYYYIEV